MLWDVFISHASEDKDTVARPLAKLLEDKGLRVWIDEQQLRIGDSLSRKINDGLAFSRCKLGAALERSQIKSLSPRPLEIGSGPHGFVIG
jgi:hypothetical protein